MIETNGLFLLYENDTINIKFLKMLFYELCINEDKRIKNILNIRDKQENKFKYIYENEKDKDKVKQNIPIIFEKKKRDIW